MLSDIYIFTPIYSAFIVLLFVLTSKYFVFSLLILNPTSFAFLFRAFYNSSLALLLPAIITTSSAYTFMSEAVVPVISFLLMWSTVIFKKTVDKFHLTLLL